jgi:hypothetical protein
LPLAACTPVRRCAKHPAGVRRRLDPSGRGAGQAASARGPMTGTRAHTSRMPNPARAACRPALAPPRTAPARRTTWRGHGRRPRLGRLSRHPYLVLDVSQALCQKNHKFTSRRARSDGRRRRPEPDRRPLLSFGQLRGSSLLTLELRLISLNSPTTPPALQTAPVVAAGNHSGWSRDAALPAPAASSPGLCETPNRLLQVPIGCRAPPRRTPVTGPPPAAFPAPAWVTLQE